MLREVQQEDTREDKLYGEERGDELPKVPRAKEALKEKIQEGVRGEGREGGGEGKSEPDGSGQSFYEGEERGDCSRVQLSGVDGGESSDRGGGGGKSRNTTKSFQLFRDNSPTFCRFRFVKLVYNHYLDGVMDIRPSLSYVLRQRWDLNNFPGVLLNAFQGD